MTGKTDSVTIESVRRAMRGFHHWQPRGSRRVTAYIVSEAILDALHEMIAYQPGSTNALIWSTFCGVPIVSNRHLEDNVYMTERADGSLVLHSDGEEWRMEGCA
jgi:hypothetical protein